MKVKKKTGKKTEYSLSPGQLARIEEIYRRKMELFRLYNRPSRKRGHVSAEENRGIPMHYIGGTQTERRSYE
jgi:hypothetical protein